MGFLDFFKPKWKHSDAQVRADAVRELGDGDQDLLARVAREDVDARVRRIALKKIEDTAVLGQVAEADPDEGLRKAAAEKASSLLLSAANAGDEQKSRAALGSLKAQKSIAEVAKLSVHASVRRAALERLTDDKLVIDVAKHAGDPEVRLAALARTSDDAAVRDVALLDGSTEVALAALERLSSPADLAAVQKRAKSKAARDVAKRRLSDEKDRAQKAKPVAAISPAARRQARTQQLLRGVESLSTSGNEAGETARALDELRQEWSALVAEGEGPDEHAQRRFDRAVAQLEAREKARAEAELALRSRADKEEEDLRIAGTLIENVASLDGGELVEGLEVAQAAWQRLGPLAGPGGKRLADLAKRFQAAVDGARKRHELALSKTTLRDRGESLCSRVEALTQPDQMDTAEKKLAKLEQEWSALVAAGVDEDLTSRFGDARARVQAALAEDQERRAQRRAEAAAKIDALLSGLEALVQTDDRKHAERELKEAQDAFNEAMESSSDGKTEGVQQRFRDARDHLVKRVQELREAEDWKRWANVPRLEKLCDRAELLMETAFREGADLPQVARDLKALQVEWKSAGPAPREKSEALWARFKQATDETYGKCKEFFGKRDGDRAENQGAKEDVCRRAEEVAAASEGYKSPAEFRAGAETIKELQEEWKTTGPVSREQSDALWQRFRKACDLFFQRRKAGFDAKDAERLENMRRQEELCARAEVLAEHEEPNWKEWSELMKEYQAEWKTIGPAPRELADAVWQRFRGACDRFFERRKEFFERMDAERVENLRIKGELCEKVEAIADGEVGSEQADAVKALQGEWKKSGPVPREQADAIWARFRAACDRVFEKLRAPEPVEAVDPAIATVVLADAAPSEADPKMGTAGFVNRLDFDKARRQRRSRRGKAEGEAEPSASSSDAAPTSEPASEPVVEAAGAPGEAPKNDQ